MKIRPLRDRVLVEMDPFDEEFGSTGIIRAQIAYDKPMTGTVRGVGPGVQTKHGFIRTTLRPGDRVQVPWGRGHDMVIDGRLFVFVHEFAGDDVVALEEAA